MNNQALKQMMIEEDAKFLMQISKPIEEQPTLAIGIITCKRPGIDVANVVQQLRRAGFSEIIHVFCEPEAVVPILPLVIAHYNHTRLGVVGNWKHCLSWLCDHTSADYLMVCEDDVNFCVGAKDALVDGLKTISNAGFFSLYTPIRDAEFVKNLDGWIQYNRGKETWGTQAMCFPRNSAKLLLGDSCLHLANQLTGPTDALVAEYFLDNNVPCYYHNPSLADHLTVESSVGHGIYATHVGIGFQQQYRATPSTKPRQPATVKPCKSAVIVPYQANIDQSVLHYQAAVVCEFLPPRCELIQLPVTQHGLGLDKYFQYGDLEYDTYLILDVDCIPITRWAIPWMLSNAAAGMIVGPAQRANHIDNKGHIYAGPCALAFSRETYLKLGRPSFKETDHGDTAEELTYLGETLGIPITLLWPTSSVNTKWELTQQSWFGNGTTYGSLFFHAFEISQGQTTEMFISKCEKVIETFKSCGP